MPFVQLLVELLTVIFCCAAVDKYSRLERAAEIDLKQCAVVYISLRLQSVCEKYLDIVTTRRFIPKCFQFVRVNHAMEFSIS